MIWTSKSWNKNVCRLFHIRRIVISGAKEMKNYDIAKKYPINDKRKFNMENFIDG